MRISIHGDYPSRGPHWLGILEGIKELGHEPVINGPGDVTIFGSAYDGKPSCFWLCDLMDKSPTLPSPIFYSVREYAVKYGGRWLPQASLRRGGIDRSNPNEDIVFVGQRNPNVENGVLYDERRRLLELTQAKIINGENKEARNAIFDSLGTIYGNAGVVLGCDAGRGLDFGMSNRVWNVLGAGGFYCTVYTKGMESVFENGRHLVWGKDAEETTKLAIYYKKHQNEARKIAEEGFRLVQGKHLYKHRLEQLLSDVRKGM